PFLQHVSSVLVNFQYADVFPADRLVGGSPARKLQTHALLQQRSGDHEDDQQHKRQVQQRRDVDVRQRHQRVALGETSHQFWLSQFSSRYSVSIFETSSCAKLSSSTVSTRRLCTSQL